MKFSTFNSNQMDKSKRLLEIDVLRGIAAISVVVYHYTFRFKDNYDHPSEILISFPYGVHGVELFLSLAASLCL